MSQMCHKVAFTKSASMVGPILSQVSAWLAALGRSAFINKTKLTDTFKHKHTVCWPAAQVLRCAYERVRRARFLHKPLSTCCDTFATKGGLGHPLKLLAAHLVPFIPLTHCSTSAASLPVTSKNQQDASHPGASEDTVFT